MTTTPEFPGCRPIHVSRDGIADYEGRLEYWEADTETAWVVRAPVSVWHELPGQRLARLIERIAAVRGAAIETVGNSDLLVRNPAGERQRILQADQVVYLRQQAIRRLGPAIEVGRDDLPDVILEVDVTTDVRRGKLALYESWGFPEVWVDVPDRRAPSSSASRKPGLTIHLLGPDGYGSAATSRAFSGWSAAEIHRALNEDALSGETVDVLRRVGRARAGNRAPDRTTIRSSPPNGGRAVSPAVRRAPGKARAKPSWRSSTCGASSGRRRSPRVSTPLPECRSRPSPAPPSSAGTRTTSCDAWTRWPGADEPTTAGRLGRSGQSAVHDGGSLP